MARTRKFKRPGKDSAKTAELQRRREYSSKGTKRLLPLKPPGPPSRRKFNPETMCGAQLRRQEPGRVCLNPKGFKSPHPGEGRCWLHGGLTPIKHGLGSLINHGRLKDMIEKVKQLDHAVMDLEPEALLMRAMVVDFVNRYDTFRDTLESWYNAIDSDNSEKGLPPIARRYPELEDAAKLLEGVSRIVERMHKITREGSITLDLFRSIMGQMGMVVAKHVKDEEALRMIELDWQSLMVAPRSFVRGRDGLEPEILEDDE